MEFLLTLTCLALSTLKVASAERFTIDSGGGGYFELYGSSNVYQGISNRTSYGLKFTILQNRISGNVSSTELTASGRVINKEQKVKGKVFSVHTSPYQYTGNTAFPGTYLEQPIIVPFTFNAKLLMRFSDGTYFKANIKGKWDFFNTGYASIFKGAFYKRGYKPQKFTLHESIRLYDQGHEVGSIHF
ncbi:MAG: hypothetical protein PHC88_16125 [Terrimicrobiaceae bacterium]|nr:hypothetical protein [Terrimicrobiaceae bacterium]